MVRFLIAAVWLINGLICKLLNFVPRHQLIVGRIMGEEYAFVLTKLIGIGEILVAIWVLSGFRSRLCAIFQITVVMTMNLIEFALAPDLLLFGKVNLVIAIVFSGIVYWNEFKWRTS